MTRQRNYAVIDIETGGFSKTKNGICEIGILIVNLKGEVIDEFCSYIKPYPRRLEIQEEEGQLVSYKDDSMAINGINIEDLENGPSAEEVGSKISELFEQYTVSTLIGHNIDGFDYPWVKEFIDRFGSLEVFPEETVDTMKLSKEKINGLKNYKLKTVCEFYSVSNMDEHRAIGDCYATLEIWKRLN